MATRYPLHFAGLLAVTVVASAGCGHRPKPEVAQPATDASAIPSTPDGSAGHGSGTDAAFDNSILSILEERISFAFDRADLSRQAQTTLSAKADALGRAPDIALRIEGHADERGSDEYNLALSQRRATAAKRFLIQQGVSGARLETVGYGEERPLQSGGGENTWALNRRAEFRVSAGGVAQR